MAEQRKVVPLWEYEELQDMTQLGARMVEESRAERHRTCLLLRMGVLVVIGLIIFGLYYI